MDLDRKANAFRLHRRVPHYSIHIDHWWNGLVLLFCKRTPWIASRTGSKIELTPLVSVHMPKRIFKVRNSFVSDFVFCPIFFSFSKKMGYVEQICLYMLNDLCFRFSVDLRFSGIVLRKESNKRKLLNNETETYCHVTACFCERDLVSSYCILSNIKTRFTLIHFKRGWSRGGFVRLFRPLFGQQYLIVMRLFGEKAKTYYVITLRLT